jgi:hypothetical protein
MNRTAQTTTAAWLAAALMACATPAQALGIDMPYESFATAPDVDWVKVCGQWPAPVQPGQGAGVYRIVHATRHAQSFLYVQWLQRDGTDSAAEVQSVGVAALNNDHASITLSQMQCKATARGIRFTARAESGHDGAVFRITIEAGHRPGALRYQSTQKR